MQSARVLLLVVLVSQCGVAGAAPAYVPKAPPPSAVQVSRQARIRAPELVSPDKTMTLDDCIQLGLKNQPTVREAQAQLQVSAGAVSVSGSALRPGVALNASYALLGGQGRGNVTNNGSVSQLLYDFGRSRSLLTEAEQSQLSSFYALEATSADVIFSVKQAYYALLENSRLVEVFKENLKDQNAHVDQAQARLTTGLGPRADVLTARASAASATVDLIGAQNAAAQALVTLNAAMGVDVRSQTQIKEGAEPDAPVPVLDDAVMQAITNRPEIAQSVEAVNAAVSALKSAKTGSYPVFSGVANGQEAFIGGSLTNGWQLALDLQWTPVDSGQIRGQITEAEGQLLLSEEALYGIRQTVSQDVTSARLNIIAAQAALASSQAEVTSAKENLDVATGRYEAGVGIFLQVTDAQSLLLKAQVDEATAQYGLSIARAAMEHAVGATTVKGTYQ